MKGVGWFELLFCFRWFFFFNLKLEEENGLFFDWEDLRKYFSDESNFEKWNNRRKRGNKGR